jgi:RNA polymerase sigma-70 factor (ECF subfamily)
MTASLLTIPHDRRVTQSGPAATGDERDMVTRAQRGDVDAFEHLYHANAGRIFGVCLRMCRDRERATELMQDVFVRVWEKLASFRGEASFSTWMHRLAVNVVLETERKDKRRGARTGGDEETDATAGEWAMARKDPVELRMDLRDAIDRLPPGARRVFILHDVEGFQHGEIAQMTGLAEGTLRAQLHRARKLLMEALER